MSNKSKQKWQHFLPQMYLRGFLDPNEVAKGQHVLWVYQAGAKPISRGPKGVAAHAHFYTAKEIVDDPNVAEDALAQIESQAVSRLEKLASGDIGLTDQEKAEFATFMAITMTRTPFFREATNSIAVAEQLYRIKKTLETPGEMEKLLERAEKMFGKKTDSKQAREALESTLAGEITVTQESRGWSVKQVFEKAMEIDDDLAAMRWGLLKAPEEAMFVTCDNPVLIAMPLTRAMRFAFPISRCYLLSGEFMRGEDQLIPINAEKVSRFNSNQVLRAHKEVYSPFKSDELQAEIDKVHKERPPIIPKITPEMIDMLNQS
jgi:hypothetical protein